MPPVFPSSPSYLPLPLSAARKRNPPSPMAGMPCTGAALVLLPLLWAALSLSAALSHGRRPLTGGIPPWAALPLPAALLTGSARLSAALSYGRRLRYRQRPSHWAVVPPSFIRTADVLQSVRTAKVHGPCFTGCGHGGLPSRLRGSTSFDRMNVNQVMPTHRRLFPRAFHHLHVTRKGTSMTDIKTDAARIPYMSRRWRVVDLVTSPPHPDSSSGCGISSAPRR